MKRFTVLTALVLILSAVTCNGVLAAVQLGDVNGDGGVDPMDASLVLQYDAGLWAPEGESLAGADVNGDGEVDPMDASLILQYDAGLINGFGEEEPEVSDEPDEDEPEDSDPRTLISFENGISIKGEGAKISNNTAVITAPGEYVVRGESSNGALCVDSSEDGAVVIDLEGVSLTNGNGPALYVLNASSVSLVAAESTVNYFEDSASYPSDWTEKYAAIFSNDDLEISGEGSVRLKGNAGHGIASDDSLSISKVSLTVVEAASDGIKVNDLVSISSAKVDLSDCGSDGIDCAGLVELNSGSLSVDAPYGVGIKSETNIKIKGGSVTVVSGEDGLRGENDSVTARVEISGGTLSITAGGDGIQTDRSILVSGGELNVVSGGGAGQLATDSANGFKTGILSMTGGTVSLDCADDAVKTTGAATVSGGKLSIESTLDGIQCETVLKIAGDGSIKVVSGGGASNESEESAKGLKGGSVVIGGSVDIKLDCADDGINGKALVSISGGSFEIEAHNDGIQSDAALTVSGGSFDIKTGGGYSATVNNSAKGLKAKGITLTGGSFDLNCSDDALNSSADISVSSASLEIKTGDDALHADASITVESGTVSVARSGEGLEGNSVTVNGGKIILNTNKDGVNVGGGADGSGDSLGSGTRKFSMTGGSLSVVSNGDAIDTYGGISISGGNLTLICNGAAENVFGTGAGSLVIDGGKITAYGRTEVTAPSASSSQRSVLVSIPSGSFRITDSEGNTIISANPNAEYAYALISDSVFEDGQTYCVYKEGESEAGGSASFAGDSYISISVS